MFFYLSKFVWAIVAPSNLLTLLVVVGLLVAFRRRRLGITLALLGAAGLVLGGVSPLSRILLATLENRFPAFVEDGRPVDGVVVLGGAELPDISAARGQPSFSDAGERMIALGDLARHYPQARVLFSGGSSSILSTPAQTESDTVRSVLPALGVAPERVLFEDRSRNTEENARFSKAILQPKAGERWLLVTSAYHMPRAIGCFRAAGFEVTAYPVDYRTDGGLAWRGYRTVADGLRDLDIAMREWIGLAVYYGTGRTGALVPAP